MSNLNLKQLNKMMRLRKLAEHGTLAITKHLFDIEEQLEMMNQVFSKIEEEKPKPEKGEKGDKGDQGESGRDGMDGKDGENGKNGRDGKDGRDGRDGADGQNGADGINGIDGINGRDGSPDSPQQMADKINTLYEKIKPEVIIGWGDLQNKIRNQLSQDFDVRIGVSKTEVKRLTDRVVTLEAGGGGGYTIETPTGSVNGSNTTFTVTVAPEYIVVDGAAKFENAGYTIAGLTITTDVPPLEYIRSFYS